MKLKSVVTCMLALSMGIATTAYARNSYYPPQQIPCTVNKVGKLNCLGFDRNFLTEDTYTADFPNGQMLTFYFSSAAAYFAPSREVTSVFYTFKNAVGKIVKLKSVTTWIRPDETTGNWKKLGADISTCEGEVAACAITNINLPVRK